jgi:hypothetical protein
MVVILLEVGGVFSGAWRRNQRPQESRLIHADVGPGRQPGPAMAIA